MYGWVEEESVEEGRGQTWEEDDVEESQFAFAWHGRGRLVRWMCMVEGGVRETELGGLVLELFQSRDVVLNATIVSASNDQAVLCTFALTGEKLLRTGESFKSQRHVLLGFKAIDGDERWAVAV